MSVEETPLTEEAFGTQWASSEPLTFENHFPYSHFRSTSGLSRLVVSAATASGGRGSLSTNQIPVHTQRGHEVRALKQHPEHASSSGTSVTQLRLNFIFKFRYHAQSHSNSCRYEVSGRIRGDNKQPSITTSPPENWAPTGHPKYIPSGEVKYTPFAAVVTGDDPEPLTF